MTSARAAIRFSTVHPAHTCFVPLPLRSQLGISAELTPLDDPSFFEAVDEVSPLWFHDHGAATFQGVGSRSLYSPDKWFRIAPEIRVGLLHDQVRV